LLGQNDRVVTRLEAGFEPGKFPNVTVFPQPSAVKSLWGIVHEQCIGRVLIHESDMAKLGRLTKLTLI
jgi:hypothetical protein